MKTHGWEYHELEKEMREASVYKLLGLFKREEKKFADKCAEMITSGVRERGEKEREAKFLDGSRTKVALRLAEKLTE